MVICHPELNLGLREMYADSIQVYGCAGCIIEIQEAAYIQYGNRYICLAGGVLALDKD